jgi:predicted adenine nucleotide alpha hydrolase (AANH) superfamily ATPase
LVPVETLAVILDAIRAVDGPFTVQADAEISIEMDPGTFSKDKLQAVKDMGFNRISTLNCQHCYDFHLLRGATLPLFAYLFLSSPLCSSVLGKSFA